MYDIKGSGEKEYFNIKKMLLRGGGWHTNVNIIEKAPVEWKLTRNVCGTNKTRYVHNYSRERWEFGI